MTDIQVQNEKLRSMVAELIDVYWGDGDSDPQNPPDVIKRAKRLLKSHDSAGNNLPHNAIPAGE